MNELKLSQDHEGLSLLVIHPSLVALFEKKAMEAYKDNLEDHTTFRLPSTLLDGDGDFYYVVDDLYNMVIDSQIRYELPEDRWDNVTDEEVSDFQELIESQPHHIEEPFLKDIKTTFEANALFYLEVETRWHQKTNKCEEVVVGVHNPPLQEVW